MFLRNMLLNSSIMGGFVSVLREGEGNGPGSGPGDGGGNNTPQVSAPWGDVNASWMLGETGKQTQWYNAALPDGPTKEFIKSKDYKNPAQMADALFSANRMVNGNVIEVPSIGEPNAPFDPKPWENFNAKLRGESIKAPGDYKFDFGKDAEGKEIAADPKLVTFAQQLAFDLGVHPKRAQELIVNKWQAFAKEVNTQSHNDMVAANNAEVEGVKKAWGANFDTFKAAGERAVKALGLSAEEMTKIEGAIGAAPMLNLFAKLGQLGAEGKLPTGDNSTQTDPSKMSPQAAQAEIDRMRSDPEISKALGDPMHPQHRTQTEKMVALYATAGSARTA